MFQSRGRFLGVGYSSIIQCRVQELGFNRGGDSWGWATFIRFPFFFDNIQVSIAGAILGGGLLEVFHQATLISHVSIAGAILGGGLLIHRQRRRGSDVVSIAGAILGGGLQYVDVCR